MSVLHQACCARPQARPVWTEIVSCCLNLGAPVSRHHGVDDDDGGDGDGDDDGSDDDDHGGDDVP